MAYCILRMAKIKSRASLVRAAQHNTRERPPLNADPERSSQNETLGGSVAEVMGRYEAKLPGNVRKNAVHAVELVMTASPEFAGDWDRYLKACDGWAARLFGQENVLHVAHHLDESAPHTQILVMPLKDGKLNAKSFIGGSRDRMTELQDDFFREVGRPMGLERGRPRAETKVRHTPHTLALRAADLDEREKKLSEKEAAVISPQELQAMRKKLQSWDNHTAADLRMTASYVERSGSRTVGEYLRKVREAAEAKQQQRQTRGINR